MLRVAAEQAWRSCRAGAGTKLGWGHPPERVDLVLDTTRLDGVVEHAAGDLVVVVGAGCRLDDLQATLAGAGQWLAVDPPRGGTVGGVVATAATGPTALPARPVRDLVIGMTVVRADGVVAKSGGKVVKNVAGYDLGKLLTGSYGTLGVVTEVAFRLHPLPADAHLGQRAGALGRRAPRRSSSRSCTPSSRPPAVELDRPPAAPATCRCCSRASRRASRAGRAGAGAARARTPPRPAPRRPGGGASRSAGDVALKLTHEIAGLRAACSPRSTRAPPPPGVPRGRARQRRASAPCSPGVRGGPARPGAPWPRLVDGLRAARGVVRRLGRRARRAGRRQGGAWTCGGPSGAWT